MYLRGGYLDKEPKEIRVATLTPLDREIRPSPVTYTAMRLDSVRNFSGDRLREIRRIRGLSQLTLAQRAGIPVSTIRNWEQGRAVPPADRLAILASALDVPIDALFAETGQGGQS